MGRKSTKENKSVWQTTREDLGLTREKAGELIPGFSPERIEKIENGRTQIQPEDVMLMAEYYKTPSLRNYYCVNECPIGQVHALRTESKELAQIAVETLNSLNKLSRSRDRLLEIVEDGEVQADEYADFAEIKSTLDRIAVCPEKKKGKKDTEIPLIFKENKIIFPIVSLQGRRPGKESEEVWKRAPEESVPCPVAFAAPSSVRGTTWPPS